MVHRLNTCHVDKKVIEVTILTKNGNTEDRNTALFGLLTDDHTDFRNTIRRLDTYRLKGLAQHIHGEIYERLV